MSSIQQISSDFHFIISSRSAPGAEQEQLLLQGKIAVEVMGDSPGWREEGGGSQQDKTTPTAAPLHHPAVPPPTAPSPLLQPPQLYRQSQCWLLSDNQGIPNILSNTGTQEHSQPGTLQGIFLSWIFHQIDPEW